jgi:hypothetical protein
MGSQPDRRDNPNHQPTTIERGITIMNIRKGIKAAVGGSIISMALAATGFAWHTDGTCVDRQWLITNPAAANNGQTAHAAFDNGASVAIPSGGNISAPAGTSVAHITWDNSGDTDTEYRPEGCVVVVVTPTTAPAETTTTVVETTTTAPPTTVEVTEPPVPSGPPGEDCTVPGNTCFPDDTLPDYCALGTPGAICGPAQVPTTAPGTVEPICTVFASDGFCLKFELPQENPTPSAGSGQVGPEQLPNTGALGIFSMVVVAILLSLGGWGVIRMVRRP